MQCLLKGHQYDRTHVCRADRFILGDLLPLDARQKLALCRMGYANVHNQLLGAFMTRLALAIALAAVTLYATRPQTVWNVTAQEVSPW